jgi:aminopeptidase N
LEAKEIEMIKKILIFTLVAITINAQTNLIHHQISATILPNESFIKVTDVITIPEAQVKDGMKFKLHNALIVEENKFIQKFGEAVNAKDIGMDIDDTNSENGLMLNVYEINVTTDRSGDLILELNFSGKIESPIKQSEENYARGFSESPGIIWEKGVYLAGSTYWVPSFDDGLVTFNLTTTAPLDWRTVSVGKRTLDEKK